MENYFTKVIPGENIQPRATHDTISCSNHWVTERTSDSKVSITVLPAPSCFLVRCLTAFSCRSTTENCIFTVPWGTWGCCGQRWHVQELWHFQGRRNSLSQASYATAWWLRSSALGRCICLVEHSSYSLGAKESGKASVNCHLSLL